MAIAQKWNTAELVAKDKANLLHPVSNLRAVREHGALVLARGEGVYLWDTDGKRYIDGFAGLWNTHGRGVIKDRSRISGHRKSALQGAVNVVTTANQYNGELTRAQKCCD